MVALTIIICVLLAVVSGCLVWYVRKILTKMWSLVDYMILLRLYLKEFHQHIESITQMDMIKDDPTVNGLLEHSKFILQQVQEFNKYVELLERQEELEQLEEELSETENI